MTPPRTLQGSRSKDHFAEDVIASLERKVQYVGFQRRKFNSVEMATL